jgi:hypothetical protein
MFFRARRAMQRAWFDFNCRALLDTPPIVSNDDSFTLVSMTCHGELMMYLLAAKSFCRNLGSTPNVILLNDGSLTKADHATITSHIPKVKILHIEDVPKGRVPKGGSWESFLLVNDIVQDSYVVQLDSDTLTINSIPEIKACIAANRSFTLLGDKSFPEIEPMIKACERSKGNLSPMVQAVCERSFDQLPEAASLKYVRGNAGFIGFPKGSITREKTEWFSDLMRRLVEDKWDEWGSEQVTTNLLIANIEGAYPLPSPKYVSYWAHPDVPYNDASFLHFIGPYRFANGYYLQQARKVIATLASTSKP